MCSNIKCGPKRAQFGPQIEHAGTFSGQISVHFDSVSQIILKLDQKKKSNVGPFGGQFDQFFPKICHH